MIDVLKKYLFEDCGDSPSQIQIESFVKSFSYKCRMYWLQRTDKIHSDDYELFRFLTNEFCSLSDEDKLDSAFKPQYGKDPLFSGKYSYAELESSLVKNLVEQLKSKPQKKSFLNWVKSKF